MFSFSYGFALVSTNTQLVNKWEFINSNGKNIFNKKFADAKCYSEGLAAVRTDEGLYGFIDITGKFISKPQYEEVGDFKEGLAAVKFQDKWGFIDKTGKEVIYPQFLSARNFSDGLALVYVTGNNSTQYWYIDKTGNPTIKLGFGIKPTFYVESQSQNYGEDNKMEIPLCDFNNGLAMIRKGQWDNVFIDKKGKTVIKPKSWNCSRFYFYHFVNEYAIGELCDKYGMLNKKGNWVVKPMFDDIGNFHEGFAKVKLNDNWGFVDEKGNVVINIDILKSKEAILTNTPFDDVADFSEELALVQTRRKFGYINKYGEWVIKPELLGAKSFNNGIARVKLSNKKGWNYIDKSGKLLFPHFL